MALLVCQLSNETCCRPMQRDAVPMPTTKISEEIQTQFSHADAPNGPVPYLSLVAQCALSHICLKFGFFFCGDSVPLF